MYSVALREICPVVRILRWDDVTNLPEKLVDCGSIVVIVKLRRDGLRNWVCWRNNRVGRRAVLDDRDESIAIFALRVRSFVSLRLLCLFRSCGVRLWNGFCWNLADVVCDSLNMILGFRRVTP